jgi:hypothetical protein
MDELAYSYGFLFVPDINNKPWTEYFYNSSSVDTRRNQGIDSAAEYFYKLKETLDMMLPNMPGVKDLTAYEAACSNLSKYFINGICKEPNIKYNYYDMLGHGKPCMIFMPGYYYKTRENETWEQSLNNFIKIIEDIADYSWFNPFNDKRYSRDNITKVIKDVFYLRYGIGLDSQDYRGYKHPKELWFPSVFFIRTCNHTPSFFVYEKYIHDRDIWSYFHFNNGKQDNSDVAVTYFVLHDAYGDKIKKSDLWETGNIAGHAFIFSDGEVITKVPYTTRTLATKMENPIIEAGTSVQRNAHAQKASGSCIHIRLQNRDSPPTDQQYESLAKLYYYFYKANNDKKLIIIPHVEFDRGLFNGEDTLKGFDFDKLYTILKDTYGIGIQPGTDGIDPERFKMYPHNSLYMKSNFPPIITNSLTTRTRMGENNIDPSGPCLAMTYLGIAQTFAGVNLSADEVSDLINHDAKVYAKDPGPGAGPFKDVIRTGLEKLGIKDWDKLKIDEKPPGDMPNLKAIATVRKVKQLNPDAIDPHYQEGTSDGEFRWDPIDGTKDKQRKFDTIRYRIYIW